MSALPPLPVRKLKAEMVLKNLDLREVSERSGVIYTTCSQILNGRLIHPVFFKKIRDAIKAAPYPREAAVA
jgi:hypothetical protein